MNDTLAPIIPNWPAPENVVAYSTTRTGGVSKAPFASLNLGKGAGDTNTAVLQNRQRLEKQLSLPQTPNWISQVHGTTSVEINKDFTSCNADASFTRLVDTVCVVMTADCLPILVCNRQGDEVAAIHAGWRSLVSGIIENTILQLNSTRRDLLVWLGPAISGAVYEVGPEVRQAFLEVTTESTAGFVASTNEGRWLADLNVLAKQRLHALGIKQIYGGDYCTYQNPEQFFSYRRDGQTGRQASLIYYR